MFICLSCWSETSRLDGLFRDVFVDVFLAKNESSRTLLFLLDSSFDVMLPLQLISKLFQYATSNMASVLENNENGESLDL